MLIYLYSFNNGQLGQENGVVFVEYEWEVTSYLADYYSSREENLLAKGLTFRKIDSLEELQNLSKRNVIVFE